MSEVAKDFIDKLIRKNPAERIKAHEALLHPFLDVKEDYNWYFNCSIVYLQPILSKSRTSTPIRANLAALAKNKNVEDGIWTRALSE